MKTLNYSITINKPIGFVFNKLIDRESYPEWGKAWGEGASFTGEWEAGEYVSFFNSDEGGTKVKVEVFKPNELIRTKHVAMVNQKNVERKITDEMMSRWIGSREDYYFKKMSDNLTFVEVVMIVDEEFEGMMYTWNQSLKNFKKVCEG